MNPLQQIPAHVRTALYWTGYVVGCITQLTTLVWVTIAAARPDVDQPLWLIIASVVLAFITNQLNLLAGVNVTDPNTVAVQAPQGSSTTVTAEVDLNPGYLKDEGN